MPCECTCHLAADPIAERRRRNHDCCEHCPICEEDVKGHYFEHKQHHTDQLKAALQKILEQEAKRDSFSDIQVGWLILEEAE